MVCSLSGAVALPRLTLIPRKPHRKPHRISPNRQIAATDHLRNSTRSADDQSSPSNTRGSHVRPESESQSPCLRPPASLGLIRRNFPTDADTIADRMLAQLDSAELSARCRHDRDRMLASARFGGASSPKQTRSPIACSPRLDSAELAAPRRHDHRSHARLGLIRRNLQRDPGTIADRMLEQLDSAWFGGTSRTPTCPRPREIARRCYNFDRSRQRCLRHSRNSGPGRTGLSQEAHRALARLEEAHRSRRHPRLPSGEERYEVWKLAAYRAAESSRTPSSLDVRECQPSPINREMSRKPLRSTIRSTEACAPIALGLSACPVLSRHGYVRLAVQRSRKRIR
jgi:hypothetical protein